MSIVPGVNGDPSLLTIRGLIDLVRGLKDRLIDLIRGLANGLIDFIRGLARN